MTLRDLKEGQTARILSVDVEGIMRQHLLDLGLIPGADVSIIKFAPMGDPVEVRVQNYELTLRLDDARHISVDMNIRESGESVENECVRPVKPAARHEMDHPGFGEDGPRFHNSADRPINESELRLALVGCPNTGKTTLFNQLTGANQHVGNFPGVTVDLKEGHIKGHPETTVVDLPGAYSLSPYSQEEIVTRRHILDHHPHGIINIADANSIERNLYLTLQLMELGIPMVLCLNMMDEVEATGGHIDINALESLLGIPVVAISAKKNQGIQELIHHIMHVARYHEVPRRQDFCDAQDHGGAVHRCLHALMHLVEDHAQRAGLPVRFAAGKLAEGDGLVTEALNLSQNELETTEHILRQMEEERGLDRQAAMADMRYTYIRRVCAGAVHRPREDKSFRRSRRIDRLLTGRWTAIPSFLLIMTAIFYVTFMGLGADLQDWTEQGLDKLTAQADELLAGWSIAPAVHSLIIDGIFGGVGSVITFVPLILLLFFFLSLLEDSGYMARIAFVTDGALRRVGLSGRSIVPLIVGFGCSVPAVMSSRTLPSVRDRRLTILLIPFMSCTAKVPVYAFLTAAFFSRWAGWIVALLYITGIVMGIIVAMLLNRSMFKGEAMPFVMELPNYRMPMAINVVRLMWEKAKDFLARAFTVIFVATIVVWFLQNFNWHLQMLDEAHQGESILATVSGWLVPLFRPLGLGDWRIVTSLLSGFMAKEAVVGTLAALLPSSGLSALISSAAAFALLVFCLLYTPCVAAVSTVRRELGTRWAVMMAVGQCVLAWVVSFLVYNLLLWWL